jgi:uncharacterized protein YaiI (UPF0178 family)
MRRILVDGDSCPSRDLIARTGKEKNASVIVYCDMNHIIQEEGYSVKYVDSGFQAVDMVIANEAKAGDIVVTGDYGVAAMALAKGAVPINQNGIIYSDENMNKLLFERHLSQKVRRSGNRVSGPSKRTKEHDEKFYNVFRQLISNMLL